MLYLQHEKNLPATKVACIDNLWMRERERQRGADTELYRVFRRNGMNAEGVTLPEGQGKPEISMFREAAQQIKTFNEALLNASQDLPNSQSG